MDSAYLKIIKRHLIHHSKVRGRKVNFLDGFWWPSWIYANYENCLKLLSWQQNSICSRSLLDNESPNKVHRKKLFKVPKCQNIM